jgi:hypothetical protein
VKVSLIVPYRPDPRWEQRTPKLVDGANRSEIWDWCRTRWERLFPDFELVTGAPDGPEMNRSKARNLAVESSTGEILVIADADTVAPSGQICEALDKVREEEAAWVIAYERYIQLDGPATRKYLALDPIHRIPPPVQPRWETSAGNAGMLVMHRDAWDIVGGYDERFIRWGWEDWAIADALETLVHPQVRVPGYVLHFCHPRDRDRSKRQGEALAKRYTAAHGDRAAMLAILAEEGRRT